MREEMGGSFDRVTLSVCWICCDLVVREEMGGYLDRVYRRRRVRMGGDRHDWMKGRGDGTDGD